MRRKLIIPHFDLHWQKKVVLSTSFSYAEAQVKSTKRVSYVYTLALRVQESSAINANQI